ncbi:hypothetical protein DL240_05875 [Lujinxingia litoralis]|uniref:Glycerophosphoryl diester phosphodiesterase membrane domain-containing protein n=1 Tax=Lujinxingia litoralis TaxID=2211119 RepID=A0A328C8L3_9DELT|nr:hypothetical protein [Lujinxingia litoralis]RAL23686.1 hypothetical protein DL240_05875 [Lujinxingia litoralis]
MVTDPRQTVKAASARSWNWVKDKTFNPLPFYRRSWELLRQDPWVFAWKMLADLLGRAASLALMGVLIAIVSLDLQHFSALGGTFNAWLARLSHVATSPSFLAGLTGAIFCVSLISSAIHALVTGGIWGLLAAGLRDDPIETLRTFWRAALLRFPDVFALFLLRFSVRLVTFCLALAAAVALIRAGQSPDFVALSPLTRALLITLPLSFLISWFALTRLVLEVIGAPMFIDNLGLGEAVLEGASFVLENFWAMYRLFIYALGLLLVPLGMYWIVLMIQNLGLAWPALTPALALLRFAGELLMWAAISALGVLFYGAVFAFYRKDDASVEEEARLSGAHPTLSASNDGPGPFVQGVGLSGLLPDDSPHRFPLDELLPELTTSDDAPPSKDTPEQPLPPRDEDSPPLLRDDAGEETPTSSDESTPENQSDGGSDQKEGH